MIIAIYSDIHENFSNLEESFKIFKQRNVEFCICLGDLINPGVAQHIVDAGIKTHLVFGNNDGDKAKITQIAERSQGVLNISGYTQDEITIENQKIYISHLPFGCEAIAKSGDYKAVFHGHTHIPFIQKLENGTIFANPGEIGAFRTGNSTFLIWDTNQNNAQIITVENSVNTAYNHI